MAAEEGITVPRSPGDGTAFHCSAEWHLAKAKSKFTPLVYSLALKIAGGDGSWHASEVNVAEYFECSRASIIRAYAELVEMGFFILVRSGAKTLREDGRFGAGLYRILSHDTWAKEHPGQCTAKLQFPWTGEAHESPRDRLGQALYRASGYRFPVKDLHFLMKFVVDPGKATEAGVVEAMLTEIAAYHQPLSQRRLRNCLMRRLCPEKFV